MKRQNEAMNDMQLFLAVGMPTLVVLIGILTNRWQVSAINARARTVTPGSPTSGRT